MRRAYVLGVLSALVAASVWAETTPPSYPFRYSTLDRSGALSLRPTSEATGLSFTLNAETFDKAIGLDADGGPADETADETVAEWRPVAFVPPTVTVTAISVAIPGTDAPAFITVTPVVEEGETESVRFGLVTDATAAETVSLVGADGIARTATLRTYVSDAGVTLKPGQACAFAFDGTEVGTTPRNFYTFDGAPHLRVSGSATITRHVLSISDGEEHSFATLANFDESKDQADQVFVVEFSGAGGTLNVDGTLDHAPLVLGTSVKSESAKVSFAACSSFTTSLSLRDGEGQGEQGGITFIGGSDTRWEPTDLLLACDFTLAAPLIVEKTIPIPAGRTFRLELDQPVGSEKNLPNLSFADATSRLELASDAASPEENPLGIPSKYQTMLCTQSGTLVLDRNVSADGFTISDLRAYNELSANRPLETHVILRDGHTYDFGSMLGFVDLFDTPIGKATLTVEGGTVEVSTLSLTATDATLDIRGGTVTANTLAGIEAGTRTAVSVAKGATLTLNNGLAEGTDSTAGVLNLTVEGTLELGGDLHMTPALRRTLRVEDGTIHATSAVKIECPDGGTSTAEDYLTVSGGGTLSGPLTVDSVTGNGTLKIGQGATVTTLYAYNGTIEGTIEGTGMIGAFTGDLGDVTLGGDWLTGEGKTLADVVAKAQNYHGTLGFTAGTAAAPKTIDFAAVAELTELPGAFRVNDYQKIIMRLDQYIDATVRWPANPQGVELTLIESGAYGGEAEIPAVPAGVTFEFKYYDAAGGLVEREEGDDYRRDPSEDGVSDELTWENAVFTGQGAWIDVEFDGTSANTGWFNLGKQNGCLVGVEGPDYGAVTANDRFFVAMGHPVSEGMTLGYRPYVAESALPSFPEEWSLAVRMTAPSSENKCILAIGNNYANATASTYSLVFATGAVEEDGTTEVVLWKFDGYADGAAQPAQDLPAKAIHELFRVKVADAQSAPHVFSVVCDGATLNLYMDGAWLNAINVPDQTLSGGLQLGQQLGGSRVSASARSRAGDVAVADGGAVDYIRFYKGAFPETAMVEMADRTPYVRENLRYVRYVPRMTMPPDLELGDYEKPAEQPENETWIQENAWLEQTWDGTKWVNRALVDQPAEGAECRILVAAGEHAIQVNVERQVEAKAADGTVTNAGRYFYSPNRTYASLVVRAQDAATSAATLRLVPYGVTKPESGDTMNARPWETQLLESAWFKVPEESSPGNRTGFRYGTLRFTGGAGDPINDDNSDSAITNFYGAAYLLDAATSGEGMNGIFDAGVCYLSKYAQVVLEGDSIQSTLEMVAGLSLTRGVTAEEVTRQLTGPVVLRGTTEEGKDYVLGHDGVGKDQASEDVWVPFFGADSTWKFYDDTRVEGGTDNANGVKSGLFARGVRATGRLFLDFTAAKGQAKYKAGSNFSEQAWYRYNYEGEAAPGATGKTAEEANADDFAQAVAFQIRLCRDAGDIVTLTLDAVPDADVQTFHVEESARTTGDPLTLALETKDGGKPLTVWQRVIAAARLDVSNNGKGNALNLRPEGPTSARRTPIHRGNSTRGAYIVGTSRVDWDFGAESSVPRLEVVPGAELTFAVGQNFRRYGTTLVAQGKDERTFPDEGSDEGPTMEDMMGGAWIHHVSAAPFLGQDIELGEGAYLGFHAEAEAQASAEREEGVVLAGELRLTGNATLRADYNNVVDPTAEPRIPHFTAAGGIRATKPGVTLIVDAPTHQVTGGATQAADTGKKFVDWNCLTTNLTGTNLHLWKTGPGTVTFFSTEPPSVSGKVTVEEGTLAVTAAANTTIGAQGLHVKAGATLADSGRMAGESRRLAIVPGGQTLSGGGTVDGVLRLESGATYVAAQDEALTVTGGLAVGDGGTADINVTLPTGTTEGGAAYVGDTPYLISGREERNVRRRLRPTLNDARWDAIAWLQDGKTFYAARKPAMPVPSDLGEGNATANAWHDGFEDLMVRQYQSLGHAYVGATQGRTRAGTAHLSASQINDALYAFSGISAFHAADEAATAERRTYIDAHNFYVAYEFGISRMALATVNDEESVVVEVKVRNALADTFGKAFAEGGAAEPAAFRSGTKIAFLAVKNGQAEPLPTYVTVKEVVADLSGTPLVDSATRAETDVRYFALPYAALKDYFGNAPILLRPSATNPVELPAQQ